MTYSILQNFCLSLRYLELFKFSMGNFMGQTIGKKKIIIRIITATQSVFEFYKKNSAMVLRKSLVLVNFEFLKLKGNKLFQTSFK